MQLSNACKRRTTCQNEQQFCLNLHDAKTICQAKEQYCQILYQERALYAQSFSHHSFWKRSATACDLQIKQIMQFNKHKSYRFFLKF